MNVRILSPEGGFIKEMGDLCALFFEDAALIYSDGLPADLLVKHEEAPCGAKRKCTVSLSGAAFGAHTLTERVYADPVQDKRFHKRQVKLCLYRALTESTGIYPPWGSLTGIRPTRLVYERMEKGMTEEEAVKDVAETFGVSGAKASLLKDIIAEQALLPRPDPAKTDIYIGIPFCTSRCRYCSFLSGEVGKGGQLLPYTEALCAEIEKAARLIDDKGLGVRAFYMGGGTPTALPADMLERILKAALPLIEKACEVTVEAGRPDTLDRQKLDIMKLAGATRISINPQTMHDKTLALIGRRHTREQTEKAYEMARETGFDHINMDLIAGLPGENEQMFSETLAWSEGLHPESLTVHTLSVKRSSVMHLWGEALPDGSMVSRMVDMGRESAVKRGMRPYYLYRQKHQAGNLENVGYALPGHACLYNVDMMEDVANVIALGAGAISKRVWPGREKVMRAPNVKEVAEYIARTDEMVERKRALWLE